MTQEQWIALWADADWAIQTVGQILRKTKPFGEQDLTAILTELDKYERARERAMRSRIIKSSGGGG